MSTDGDQSDHGSTGPDILFESPHKHTSVPMKRDARTAQLREDNFVVKLTVEQFEEKFYKPYLPDFDLKDCLLASDEYAGAVRAIRAAERSSKSSTVLEKAAYHPVCAILNKMCDKYASTRYVPDEDRIQFIVHAANPPYKHPHKLVEKHAHQHPDIVALKRGLARLVLEDIETWKKRPKLLEDLRKPAVAWHHILSALEGKGKVDQNGLYQAATYAGSLLQARPDLPRHFSLSFDVDKVQILYTDPAGVYATPELNWSSEDTHRILVSYVYFVHVSQLADSLIRLHPPSTVFDKAAVKDWSSKSYAAPPVWIVYDDLGNRYFIDRIISIGEPWTRMNWVAVSSKYGPKDEPPTERTPVVIKDSWLQPSRLDHSSEGALLDRIHLEGRHVLGVMRKVHAFVVRKDDEILSTIHPDVLRNEQAIPIRHRYRLILDASLSISIFECTDVMSFFIAMFRISRPVPFKANGPPFGLTHVH